MCVCVCVCVYRFFFVGFYFHNIVFGKMLYILIILILLHLWRLVFWLNSGSVLEDFIWALECDCVAFEWNLKRFIKSSSVQFSCSIMSNSLWPHESQHTRPPCPSQLPEFTQTHIHRVDDAIQSSHPLACPSPPAPNPSQHQSLCQWVNSLQEVAKVLEFQL